VLSVPAASSLGSCVALSITTVANGTFGLLCGYVAVAVFVAGCVGPWSCCSLGAAGVVLLLTRTPVTVFQGVGVEHDCGFGDGHTTSTS